MILSSIRLRATISARLTLDCSGNGRVCLHRIGISWGQAQRMKVSRRRLAPHRPRQCLVIPSSLPGLDYTVISTTSSPAYWTSQGYTFNLSGRNDKLFSGTAAADSQRRHWLPKRRGPRSGKDRRWLPAAAHASLDEAKMAMKESRSVLNNVNFDRIFAICQKIVIFDR